MAYANAVMALSPAVSRGSRSSALVGPPKKRSHHRGFLRQKLLDRQGRTQPIRYRNAAGCDPFPRWKAAHQGGVAIYRLVDNSPSETSRCSDPLRAISINPLLSDRMLGSHAID